MKKVALLIGTSILGFLFVGMNLLSPNRVDEPRSFDPQWSAHNDAEQTIAKVNAEFRDYWQTEDLQFAGQADDLLIARRISLALTGTVPSLEEIRALESKPAEERVNWWVSYLLKDQRYPDYFAERFARAYVGVENGPFLIYRRRRFVSWLSERFAQNRPYNEMVHDILTSEGLWTNSPPVNFFTVTVDQNGTKQPDPIRLAARTSRAFLGMRIDCLQCHDDKLGGIDLGTTRRGGVQQDFHQLAAFFAETKSTGGGLADKKGEEYNYKFLGKEEQELVRFSVPYQPELLPENGDRREKLAGWITHKENKPFARAIVNRVWALMFGKPLQTPIDNILLHGQPYQIGKPAGQIVANEYSPGLQTLADDFMEHGYDLQRLIRLIVATEAFQRDWRADFEVTNHHENKFAVFPLTRLRPEQVSGSVIQAASLSTINVDSHIIAKLGQFGQTNDFINRFGDTGEDEFDERNSTIPQRLVLMNGQLVGNNSQANALSLNAPGQIARLTNDDATAIETLFLVTLTRRPNETELQHFGERLRGLNGPEHVRAVEDMYWLYFNSTEFNSNH